MIPLSRLSGRRRRSAEDIRPPEPAVPDSLPDGSAAVAAPDRTHHAPHLRQQYLGGSGSNESPAVEQAFLPTSQPRVEESTPTHRPNNHIVLNVAQQPASPPPRPRPNNESSSQAEQKDLRLPLSLAAIMLGGLLFHRSGYPLWFKIMIYVFWAVACGWFFMLQYKKRGTLTWFKFVYKIVRAAITVSFVHWLATVNGPNASMLSLSHIATWLPVSLPIAGWTFHRDPMSLLETAWIQSTSTDEGGFELGDLEAQAGSPRPAAQDSHGTIAHQHQPHNGH